MDTELRKYYMVKKNYDITMDEQDIVDIHDYHEVPASKAVFRESSFPKDLKKGKSYFKKFILVASLSIAFTGLGFGIGLNFAPFAQNSAIAAENASATQITFTSSNIDLPLSAANQNVTAVVKAVSNSVVSINMQSNQRNVFNQYFPVAGSGSGIIFGEDDQKIYIVTNNHVISKANKVTISIDDDKQAPANYVGSDPKSDLAVISVNKSELKAAGIDSYAIANFGDSETLEVGETVVAIGNALGEGKTATLGIISAKNKKITIDNRALNVIQTDAAINPGNSGGALVNSKGQVIGINTAKLSSAGVEGMGYSIPVAQAKVIVDQLMNGDFDQSQTPVLGIQGMTITKEMQEMYKLPFQGVFVNNIVKDSAASTAGLNKGDIIVGIKEQNISSMEELSAALASSKPGETIKIYVYTAEGNRSVLSATLGTLQNENF